MKIVVLIFFVIFQSYVLEKKKICDYSIIHRIYDCDSVNNLWKSSFELGIRQLDIRNINIVKENNRIYVTAQIIDKQSKEPMPYSLVYKLTGDDINCNIKKLPFQANDNGYFKITLKKEEKIRLLFTMLSMENVELMLFNCK